MKVKDPVCKMDVDSEKASAKFEYKGTTYHFCAPGCSKAFQANPEKYLGEAEAAPALHFERRGRVTRKYVARSCCSTRWYGPRPRRRLPDLTRLLHRVRRLLWPGRSDQERRK